MNCFNNQFFTPSQKQDSFRFVRSPISINDVNPSEIPTDGSWGIFVMQDLNMVYLIRNTLTGIEMKPFELKEVQNGSSIPTITIDDIKKLIEDNNDKLRSEFASYTNRNRNHNNKGGVKNE